MQKIIILQSLAVNKKSQQGVVCIKKFVFENNPKTAQNNNN
jgi:hypothetical protein